VIQPIARPTALERPGCPLCGGEPSPAVFSFPPYAVAPCAGCGAWFLSPRLPEERMRSAYASDGYFEGEGLGYSSYLAQERTLRRTFRRLLRDLARRGGTGGRLLEVGCAYGFFLDEAAPHFRERVGTDYSPLAAERARATGARVHLGGLAELPKGEVYGCAACIHVIEHVYEPVEFLAELRQRLKSGATILLAAPDMGSWWRVLLGRRWPFFKVPEHVSFFDRRSMPELLRRAGFDAPEPIPYASYFPLALIGEKARLPIPRWLRDASIWLPATSVAFVAKKP